LDLTNPDIQNRLGTSLAELTGDWLFSQDLHQQGMGPLPPTQLLAKIAHEKGTIVAIRYRSAKNIRTGANLARISHKGSVLGCFGAPIAEGGLPPPFGGWFGVARGRKLNVSSDL
jgi:hypothetical protein